VRGNLKYGLTEDRPSWKKQPVQAGTTPEGGQAGDSIEQRALPGEDARETARGPVDNRRRGIGMEGFHHQIPQDTSAGVNV
jgi:hypothetical protein